MIQIYHNPRCGKSREAKSILEEKGLDFETIEYLKYPLTKATLEELVEKIGISPEDLVRKQEGIFKDKYKNTDLNDSQWIEAMIEHPILIERPIVVNGNKAVVARPAEKVEEVL